MPSIREVENPENDLSSEIISSDVFRWEDIIEGL